MSNVVTRVTALEDSMNEFMKQQTSQMSNLMNTVKKISPPVNTSSQSVTGASFIQQQRVRMESLSKKHKLDDDKIEVFPTPHSTLLCPGLVKPSILLEETLNQPSLLSVLLE